MSTLIRETIRGRRDEGSNSDGSHGRAMQATGHERGQVRYQNAEQEEEKAMAKRSTRQNTRRKQKSSQKKLASSAAMAMAMQELLPFQIGRAHV